MTEFIELLERRISGCDALCGLEREKAVYQSVLKDYKKQLKLCEVSRSLPTNNRPDFEKFLTNHSITRVENPKMYKWREFEYDERFIIEKYLEDIRR